MLTVLAAGCGGNQAAERVVETASDPTSVPAGDRSAAPTEPEHSAEREAPETEAPHVYADAFARAFGEAGAFHLVMDDGHGGLRCEPFRAEPARPDSGHLVAEMPSTEPPLALSYQIYGTVLIVYGVQVRGHPELESLQTCEHEFGRWSLEDDATTVGATRWFTEASACELALGEADAAATDFGSCTRVIRAARRAEARGPQANERLLRILGGTRRLYWVEADACVEATFEPGEDGIMTGALVIDSRQHGTGSVATYGYDFGPYSQLLLFGPGVRMYEDSEETRGYRMNCVTQEFVESGPGGALRFGATPWFTTHRACERARRRGIDSQMPCGG